jgi:hypothetical protein
MYRQGGMTMPCNDPTLNLMAILATKIDITDKEALKLALYDLAKEHKSFFYQETANGFDIQSEEGNLTLTWNGTKYEVKGRVTTGQRAINPVIRRYQAVKVQAALVEKGYMTEPTELDGNRIQIFARRM